jgi:muramidase (phage lysozyme)
MVRTLALVGAALGLLVFAARQARASVSWDATGETYSPPIETNSDAFGVGAMFVIPDVVSQTLSAFSAPSSDEVSAVSADSNVQAFLKMIRAGEGTDGPNGYRMLFGGGLFDSFADHPRRSVTARLGGKPITSTAAGAYQFLSTTWDDCRRALGLTDFSPESQDRAAIYLIGRRRALDDVRAGRFESAVQKCAKEWASLPGSPYGQPVKTLAQARQVYESNGGSYA